jgi:hypothetical protein
MIGLPNWCLPTDARSGCLSVGGQKMWQTLWVWLGDNSKEVGALGAIVFGVSSAILTGVALWVSYRNNFG